MASSERFGYEWDKYDFMLPQYEEQFLKWVTPLTKDDFKGKSVLDAGCGMGRNSYWPVQYGASKVVGFDMDDRSLNAARENLKKFDNVAIQYGEIHTYNPGEQFDIVFSIGVIHHLYNPEKALRNLVRYVKPGGRLLIWVYGYEGNEWVVKFVNPLRKALFSKLPLGIMHALTYIPSIPLYLYIKLFPQKSAYLNQLKGFSFKHIHSIAFDQLIPEVANYWTKEEATALLSDIDELHDVVVFSVNGLSWSVSAIKK